MELSELLKLIPEGVSVGAVIFVVAMFLQHISKSQALFQAQIDNITKLFKETLKENTQAVNSLKDRINEIVK